MLVTQHGKRFARSGLPIHEDRAIPILEGKFIYNIKATFLINLLIGMLWSECMIVDELIPIISLNSR
jgi:hypothetical protein